MSDFKGLRWIRGRQDTTRQTYEEITPSSGWTQDFNCHYLLVDLPGFKRSDVKLQFDESGTIAVSGERLMGVGKRVHFQKDFKVPEDVDTKKITMRFEGETLKVTVPKVAKEKKEEQESKNEASSNNSEKKEEQESKNEASSHDSRDEEKKEEPEIPDDDNAQETEEHVEEQNASYPEEENSSNLDQESKNLDKGDNITSQDLDQRNLDQMRKILDKGDNITSQDLDQKNLDQKRKNSDKGDNSTSKKSVICKISDNKGIIMISLLSFTLGVLLSQKFHPPVK